MKTYQGRSPRPFASRAEVALWLKDPRYNGSINQRDQAFIEYCEECLKLTPDEHVGANVDLQKAMGINRLPEYQDPFGELNKHTDIYHDYSQALRDQSSALYKTSPFERERVARKIWRSVPDEAVESGSSKYDGSIQLMGDGTEEGNPE